VLVNGQSNAAENGLYQVQTVGAGNNGTWVRTSDANQDGEIQPGMVVMVTQGTVYADTPWKLVTNGEIIIGTTELTFQENYSLAFGNVFANGTAVIANSVSAPLTLSAGDNISITGNNISKTVTIAVTGISLTSIANGTSNVDIATADGNVTTTVNGNTTLTITDTGANVIGYVTATGNISGNYISGNGSGLSGIDSFGNIDANGTAILAGSIGDTLTLIPGNNIEIVGNATSKSMSIAVTGISLNSISNGTSNVTVVSSGGNVTVGVGGSEIAEFSSSGLGVTGTISGNGTTLTGINAFGNIVGAGESTVAAGNTSDTLTFAEGSGISIVTDAANNIITIGSVATDSIFATGGDMGLVTEAVTVSEDLGLIADAATVEYDLGLIVTSGVIQPDSLILPTKTVAELANLSANPAAQFVYCSDESGGAVPAFSDGTNWRRVTDREIVT
jgi:hypothetical protein